VSRLPLPPASEDDSLIPKAAAEHESGGGGGAGEGEAGSSNLLAGIIEHPAPNAPGTGADAEPEPRVVDPRAHLSEWLNHVQRHHARARTAVTVYPHASCRLGAHDP